MSTNINFYKEVLTGDRYLNFLTELDYLTGLQRTNRDLLKFVSNKTREALDVWLQYIDLEVTPEHFDDIDLDMSISSSVPKAEQEQVVERMRNSIIDDQARDELIDASLPSRPNQYEDYKSPNARDLAAESTDEFLSLLASNLTLLAVTIKNCELVELDLKEEQVNTCLGAYLRFLYVNILETIQRIDNTGPEEVLDRLLETEPSSLNAKIGEDKLEEWVNEPANLRQLKIWLRNQIPLLHFLMGEGILNLLMGTPQLQIVLDKEIDAVDNPLAQRLMATLIYITLELPGYLDKVELILKDVIKKNYYREIIAAKLWAHYATKDLGITTRKRIENIMGNIITVHYGGSSAEKSLIIGRLRQRGMRSI
jgi:hypothetical protein